MYQSTQSRWLALTHRAPASHSAFIYGVKSTKIYCRPTCPARLARRANVIFYDTAEQALHDGFRPCKRCKPDDASFVGEREEVVSRVIALLRIKKDEVAMKRSLKQLAEEVGVTPSYLCRVFKKTMGITIGAYMTEFERESSEGESEVSVQTLEPPAAGVVYDRPELLPQAITPVDGHKGSGGLAEMEIGDIEGTLNFDLNFNLDEWFWTEDFLNDSIHGLTVQGGSC